MMTLREQLIHVADRYCQAVGLSRARVSTIVLGRGSKLDDLARGGDVTTRIFEQAVSWFSANWPDGTDWPNGIARPAPQPQASAGVVGRDEAGAGSLPAKSDASELKGGADNDHGGENAADRLTAHRQCAGGFADEATR
ncbi:hypothetical protein [Jiella endophytica]|uniref:hypothetical protein n=1 Tax=Jiella endophytica TaxID=2558362 RepID=UPI001FE03470|nr:hypothetical protein [Jiella endophytica]